jgi:hypothetical protein
LLNNSHSTYFRDTHGDEIGKLSPNSPIVDFKMYIPVNQGQAKTTMIENFDNIRKLIATLETDLKNKAGGYKYTQHYLELYTILISWGLTYGKVKFFPLL